MSTIDCPICEYYVDLDELGGDMGLLSAMGAVPTGLTREAIELAEVDMGAHLTSHTVVEWVTAMRMADLYIDKLETGLVKAVTEGKELAAKVKALSERSMPMQYAPEQLPPGLGAPPPPPGMELDPWAFESPRERQEVARQRRKAGLSYVPKDSLIPFIPAGKRPEGVVGRRN